MTIDCKNVVTEVTDNQLHHFCQQVHAIQQHSSNAMISFERGRKYARIVIDHGGQRSVWAFIGLANGDIFLPASWKTPAKHPRGNIRNGLEGCTAQGPVYLR